MSASDARLSGGCQCGAVRFSCSAPTRISICHCRMCQKATGGVYGAFASVDTTALSWTRGARKIFHSSNVAQRGFCADCGTPLTWEGDGEVAISIAAFDRPADLKPQVQLEFHERIPWVHDLGALPARNNADYPAVDAFMASVVSLQHPDHDTDTWPPEERAG